MIESTLYTAEALSTGGGRDGHVRTADGQLDLDLAVDLEVVIPDVPHEQAQALADAADRICPYSNATRGNIQVNVTVSDD